MIGNAKEKNGLLDTKKTETPHAYQIKGVQKGGTLEDYWLLHERLRHLGFHYMRKLHPNLGNSLDFSKLKSEICE